MPYYIFHNPPFGGRGPSLIKVCQRKFDSTKGFPGEGWSDAELRLINCLNKQMRNIKHLFILM